MNNISPTGYLNHPRNYAMGKIDRLESSLDNRVDDKRELFRAYRRCLKACRNELRSFARECEISGGNPGLDLALGGLRDLIRDMAHDPLVKIEAAIEADSISLDAEYRKQGVA